MEPGRIGAARGSVRGTDHNAVTRADASSRKPLGRDVAPPKSDPACENAGRVYRS